MSVQLYKWTPNLGGMGLQPSFLVTIQFYNGCMGPGLPTRNSVAALTIHRPRTDQGIRDDHRLDPDQHFAVG